VTELPRFLVTRPIMPAVSATAQAPVHRLLRSWPILVRVMQR